jgi:hypothetical protein
MRESVSEFVVRCSLLKSAPVCFVLALVQLVTPSKAMHQIQSRTLQPQDSSCIWVRSTDFRRRTLTRRMSAMPCTLRQSEPQSYKHPIPSREYHLIDCTQLLLDVFQPGVVSRCLHHPFPPSSSLAALLAHPPIRSREIVLPQTACSPPCRLRGEQPHLRLRGGSNGPEDAAVAAETAAADWSDYLDPAETIRRMRCGPSPQACFGSSPA